MKKNSSRQSKTQVPTYQLLSFVEFSSTRCWLPNRLNQQRLGRDRDHSRLAMAQSPWMLSLARGMLNSSKHMPLLLTTVTKLRACVQRPRWIGWAAKKIALWSTTSRPRRRVRPSKSKSIFRHVTAERSTTTKAISIIMTMKEKVMERPCRSRRTSLTSRVSLYHSQDYISRQPGAPAS